MGNVGSAGGNGRRRQGSRRSSPPAQPQPPMITQPDVLANRYVYPGAPFPGQYPNSNPNIPPGYYHQYPPPPPPGYYPHHPPPMPMPVSAPYDHHQRVPHVDPAHSGWAAAGAGRCPYGPPPPPYVEHQNAAVAYVGESTLQPLRYYHNITSNTLLVLEAMTSHGVKTLIYSSTCATYGEPKKMPITEETPQNPINPYGKAKKMSEDIILDFSKNSDMAVMILRYFNVIGSDPEGRLGEAPRPELREQGRISGACFDAARGIIPGLKVKGTDYKTSDGTCIRDYIDVTDLVDAHVKALEKATVGKVGIYNVGTGKGRSVKEFVEACKKATGVNIKVEYLARRPGDYAEVFSDPTKIRLELNWTARYTDLQESLGIAWRWQKAHREGYGPALSTPF